VYDDHGGNYTIPSFGGGAGLHAGHDWQSDTFVFGVLADVDFLSNDESDSDEDRATTSSLNWTGTVRGRAGVATGDALFYASAGFAYGDAELVYQDLSVPIEDTYVFDDSRYGWVIGLGTEKKMSDNSSFVFEVLYTKYGEENALSGETCSDNLVTEACEMLGYDDTITVKAGYSYRFGSLGGL
jgi:outer membrane autotransporter protein